MLPVLWMEEEEQNRRIKSDSFCLFLSSLSGWVVVWFPELKNTGKGVSLERKKIKFLFKSLTQKVKQYSPHPHGLYMLIWVNVLRVRCPQILRRGC